MKHRSLTAAVFAALLLSTAACTGSPDTDDGGAVALDYAWWGGDARNEVQVAVVDLFMDQNSAITINPQTAEFPSHFERLTVQASGQNLPDLIQMQDRFLAQFADVDALLDLRPYVDDGTIDVSGVDPAILAQGTVDGKLVMIPTSTSFRGMTFDAAMYEAAGVELPTMGVTWEDMAETWTTMADSGALDDRTWPIVSECNYDVAFLEYIFAHGVEPFAGDELAFTAEDAAAWFTYWQDLMEVGAVPPAAVQTEQEGGTAEDSMFAKGAVATTLTPSNQFPIWQQRGDSVQMTAMPEGPAGSGNRFVVSGQSVAANSEHPREAAEFINFFLNDIDAAITYNADNGVPTSADPRDAVFEETQLEFIRLFNEIRPTIREAAPYAAAATGLPTVLERLCEEVAYETSTPAEAGEALLAELAQS